jgi:hypothetical protein
MGSSDVSAGDTILASQQNDLRDDVIDQVTTKGDLMVATGADTMIRLAIGANDAALIAASGEASGLKYATVVTQALATAGTSTAVASWTPLRVKQAIDGLAATGGGSLTFIQTAVASNDATLGVSGIDSTYDTYLIIGSDLVPASNDQDLFFRLGDSGGIDSGAGNYEWSIQRFHTGGTTFAAKSATSSTYIQIAGNDTIGGVGNQAGEGVGFVIWLPMPSDATMKPGITGSSTYVNGSGTGGGSIFYGQRDAVITTTQAEIHFASGNVSTGRLTLWGIKHS